MDKLALKFKKNYLLNKNHHFISHCYLISHVLFYFILFLSLQICPLRC